VTAAERIAPPRAPRHPVVREMHGRRDTDNYAWMRDHDARAFGDYLAAERSYYDAQTGALLPLISRLREEAASRLPAGSEDSVSWTLRGYRYWQHTPPGAEGRQLLRAPLGAGPEGAQLLLDENELGRATGYIDIGAAEPSPDDRLLAWSADTTGSEIYRLRFTEIGSAAALPDVIEASYPGGGWSADSAYFFYLVPDELNRPWQVRRHLIGSPAAADAVVYTETDARYELTVAASRSGELLIITAASRDTTEVLLIPAARPLAAPAIVEPRRRGVEYRVDHAADPVGGPGELLIVTDDGAAEFTLMRAPVAAPGRANWVPVRCPAVAPARPDTRLLSCDVFAGRLLLTLRRDNSQLLVTTNLDGSQETAVWPQLAAGSCAVQRTRDYDSADVTVAEQSLTEPPRWSALDLRTGQRNELKRAQVPGYRPDEYRTERIWAVAADGTSIPVSLARRAGTPLDGTAPCLLYGYGAYEACLDPEFDRSLPSLLDRGVVYAIAHIRGGGEGGRQWWQQGRLRAKPTSFTDFIDVADWLAGDAPGSAPLVDGGRIACRGLSAGGLLAAAVYSQAPARWRAVVAEVPFVDCVTTMADPDIPLTVSEWDEWGDPRDPADYACLRAYSPYDNPPAGPRPDLLVTGAVHDPRVLVHEPAKWVARLRETDTEGSRVLFRVELGAGAHTGPSGRLAQLGYEAEVQAFILAALGAAGQDAQA